MPAQQDCITFLHEAQREKFEPRQVVDIVRSNFDDQALRDHIYVVAQNMTRPSVHDETMSKVDDTLLEGDIRRGGVFNIILASQTSADLGREGSIVNTDTREEKVSLSSREDAQIKDDEKMVHERGRGSIV